MYLSKSDFAKLEAALQLFPTGQDFCLLPQEQRDIIIAAEMVLFKDAKKRKKYNKKQNATIQEKRKENWNYGRSKKEIEKRHQAQEKRANKCPSTQLNNTCYHCNYYRLMDDNGNGHCLHRETTCGMVYYMNEACEHYEQETVKNVCTKHCKDCKYFHDLDVCGSKICTHIDNRSYLIQGTYEACASFQPR